VRGTPGAAPRGHGKWHTIDPDRWAASLDGYRPSVGTAVSAYRGTANDAFNRYIDAVHCRVHPIFAESFLVSLEKLPATSSLNSPELRTTVEIVLDEAGAVARIGIVASGGVKLFDVAVLESISSAAPFGSHLARFSRSIARCTSTGSSIEIRSPPARRISSTRTS
jgi:hypothetical protein